MSASTMRVTFIVSLVLCFIQVSGRTDKIHRKGEMLKQHLVLETFVYIDYTEYQRWVTFKSGNEAKAKKECRKFYAYAMMKVNEIYGTIVRPDFSLSVTVSSIFINTKKSVITESSQLDIYDAFNETEHIFKKKFASSKLKGLDAIVLVANFQEEWSGDLVMGISNPSSACTDKALVIVKALHSLELISTLAHELGHSLGAEHDGDSVAPCEPDLFHNMSPTSKVPEHHLISNAFMFSNCSINSFKEFIDKLNRNGNNCLLKTDAKRLRKNMKQPGELYSLDEQCKLQSGQASYYCGGGSVCRNLLCYNPHMKTCLHTIKVRQTAADGSQCGNRMWCLWNECVHDSRAPSSDTGVDNCLLGDYKGGAHVGDAPICDKMKATPILCYDPFYKDVCCETCETLKEIEECGYGDRKKECENIVKLNPKNCILKPFNKMCCKACSKYYKEEDIGYLDLINTETCKDNIGCSGLFPASCYLWADHCCATCAVFGKNYHEGCKYGDWLNDCTQEMCESKAESCCDTCKTVKYSIERKMFKYLLNI